MKLLMSCAQGTAACNDVGGGLWAPPGLIIAFVVIAIAVVALLLAMVLWIRRNVKPRDEWPLAAPDTAKERT